MLTACRAAAAATRNAAWAAGRPGQRIGQRRGYSDRQEKGIDGTLLFRALNPELFWRPHRLVGVFGTAVAATVVGYLAYDAYRRESDREYRERQRAEAMRANEIEGDDEAEWEAERRQLARIAARDSAVADAVGGGAKAAAPATGAAGAGAGAAAPAK
eukprot:c15296_g1_i1.p2 GENE.c15296_g1_i1~~c15296_g1_i1.p2  ORF type:complete len:158 (-),score=18.98 c15296_g1_i1:21-494(-)